MKKTIQGVKLPVRNFDIFTTDSTTIPFSRNGVLFPDSIRCLIVGSSACGKSNAMFSLLFHPNGVRFKNVYIFCKTLNQPKYKLLDHVLNNEGGVKGVELHLFTDNKEVIAPNEAKPYSVMVFDDIACESHDNIRKYFAMGRHNLIDVFYIAQSYSKIPKQLVRDNSNFLVIFKQDDMNLKHIYDDHVNGDMTYKEFKGLCHNVWNKGRFGFVCVNKESASDHYRYRIGFDTPIKSI